MKIEIQKFLKRFKKNTPSNKEEINQKKRDFFEEQFNQIIDSFDSNKRIVILDDLIDDFILWHFKNILNEQNIDVQKLYQSPMKNFIEKMAVWYELRYPDYEINRLIPSSHQENTEMNNIAFNNNPYVNNLLDENSDIRALNWSEFYNFSVFIHSQPWIERCLFLKPKYQEIVYWNPNHGSAHLHLTKNGIIKIAEFMNYVIPGIQNEDLEGKHIKDIVRLLKEQGIEFPENNEFEIAIKNYDNWIYQKEEMLNCVMYRIIERGGKIFGPRRAFLFAKEFSRNIECPMKYGIDYSDPGLRNFINEYIKAGGSKDLVCYVNYFHRRRKYENLQTTTIQELLLTQKNSETSFYTPEENDLHQRLINALAYNLNQNTSSNEEIRLTRKKEEN